MTTKKRGGLATMAAAPSKQTLESFIKDGPPDDAPQTPVAPSQPVEAPQVSPEAAKPPVAPAKPSKGLQASPIDPEEPLQRLTLDIPLSLHVSIKAGCAMRRTKMREEVLALLEAHYRPTEVEE